MFDCVCGANAKPVVTIPMSGIPTGIGKYLRFLAFSFCFLLVLTDVEINLIAFLPQYVAEQ